ncbi:MAG: hypothetical protein AAGH40_01990 [Verrucomicrobiota bacterium]
MRNCPYYVALFLIVFVLALPARAQDSDVGAFVEFLLEDDERFEEVAFAEVVEAVSGCKMLPVDRSASVDQFMLQAIEAALGQILTDLSDPEDPIHAIKRINETSRVIEDRLLKALNAADGLVCSFPANASGELQRSGYPDLRLLHEASGRVFYIDPKVYKSGSEKSSFRTFYFEPQGETNKILDNASHLIVGISHAGKVDDLWIFETWQIVDLVDFKVRLKAEFQASNKDLYQESAVLRRGGRDDD